MSKFVKVQHSTGLYATMDIEAVSFVLDPGYYKDVEVEVPKYDEETGKQIEGETEIEVQKRSVGKPGFFTVICAGTPTELVSEPEDNGAYGYEEIMKLLKGMFNV